MSALQQAPGRNVVQWVCAERVRVLYAGIKIAAVSGPIGLILLSVLFWEVVDQQRIVIWAVVSGITICPLSLALLAYFRRRNQLPHDAQFWLRLVTWRYFLGCMTFGSAGFALFASGSITHQMILFCFLIALASSQTAESAQERWIYMTSIPALLVPFIFRAAAEDNATSRLLALLAGAALAYVVPTARNLSKMIDESLTNRFRNLELIQQLQVQKELAEKASASAESARYEAVTANQAKSRFLAAASHDLRQPVHALGLFAAAARAHVHGAEGHLIMDKITASIDSTEALFNALLDVSRLDAGIMVPDLQPFALDGLLARLVEEYAPRAAAKSLTLRWRPSGKTISSDPALLERVLRNYLSNAIRYTYHGSVLLACRTRGAGLSVQVWDTGSGIAADKLDDIFQEFYQIGNPERNKANGLGLGLAIVMRIAKLLDHPIEVKSTLNRGSKFSIIVPLAETTRVQTSYPVIDAIPAPDKSLLIGAVVLVIDDERVVLQAIELLLRQWGCLVIAAQTQSEAMQALQTLDRTPDVILCDYRLKGEETGIAAIKQLRQALGPISAALITGDTAPDRLLEASHSGLPLLHKPLNALQLKTRLCQLLAQAQSSPVRRDDTVL